MDPNLLNQKEWAECIHIQQFPLQSTVWTQLDFRPQDISIRATIHSHSVHNRVLLLSIPFHDLHDLNEATESNALICLRQLTYCLNMPKILSQFMLSMTWIKQKNRMHSFDRVGRTYRLHLLRILSYSSTMPKISNNNLAFPLTWQWMNDELCI